MIARDHYREFVHADLDPWLEDLETNRLVTILMCTMPAFAKYVDPRLDQMQWISHWVFRSNGDYVLDRANWETLLYAPMRSFQFPEKLEAAPRHLDIFAIFPFAYLALVEDQKWTDLYHGHQCVQWRRMHMRHAGVDFLPTSGHAESILRERTPATPHCGSIWKLRRHRRR